MKAHLLITTEPWPGDSEAKVTVLCGKELFPARIVFMWDEQAMGEEIRLNRLKCCVKCQDQADDLEKYQTGYVYGLVEGHESKV